MRKQEDTSSVTNSVSSEITANQQRKQTFMIRRQKSASSNDSCGSSSSTSDIVMSTSSDSVETPRLSKAAKYNKLSLPQVVVTPQSQHLSQIYNQQKRKQPKEPITPIFLSSSSERLPPLSSRLKQSLLPDSKPLKFSINEECTSLRFSPSGRLIAGGFADGTVRLFDLTGRFALTKNKQSRSDLSKTSVSTMFFDSKDHQAYGAVAGQIHAKGVHTSLLLTVDISEDCRWCFAGVLRGSMELLAIDLSKLESKFDSSSTAATNLLDCITVHRHADAKLRGFGACTRLQNQDKYLLFTGKAIKNIHIWSFMPPRDSNEDPVLTQLYDTQTNGNTIHFLQFRRYLDPTDGATKLQALSKSDGHKLRVWDISCQDLENGGETSKRPPYTDIPNSEGAVAVAGALCICGGSDRYNQMSLVSLEHDAKAFNHTELSLPGTLDAATAGRRANRGDLKSLEAAAVSGFDADHVLLQLSDGSVWNFSPSTLVHPHSDEMMFSAIPHAAFGILPPDVRRCVHMGRVGQSGLALGAAAIFSSDKNKGRLVICPLESPVDEALLDRTDRSGYWGLWAGVERGSVSEVRIDNQPKKKKRKLSDTSSSSSAKRDIILSPADSPVQPIGNKYKELEAEASISQYTSSPQSKEKERKRAMESDDGELDCSLPHSNSFIESGRNPIPNAEVVSPAMSLDQQKPFSCSPSSILNHPNEPTFGGASSHVRRLDSGEPINREDRRPALPSELNAKSAKPLRRRQSSDSSDSFLADKRRHRYSSQSYQLPEPISEGIATPPHVAMSDEFDKPLWRERSFVKSASLIKEARNDRSGPEPHKSSGVSETIQRRISFDNLSKLQAATEDRAFSDKPLTCSLSYPDLLEASKSGKSKVQQDDSQVKMTLTDSLTRSNNIGASLLVVQVEQKLHGMCLKGEPWSPPAITLAVSFSDIPVTINALEERLAYNRAWLRQQKRSHQTNLLPINQDTAQICLCQSLWRTVLKLQDERDSVRNDALTSWQGAAQSLLQWQTLERGYYVDTHAAPLDCHSHFVSACSLFSNCSPPVSPAKQ